MEYLVILYQLQCDSEHQFEAWFKDSQTYDKQAKENSYMPRLRVNKGKQGPYGSEDQ